LDAISSARSGVVNAMSSLDSAGTNLSNAFSRGEDPTKATVDLVKAGDALRASLAAMKTGDHLFKSLLDIKV
jgi:hypothetical protein